MPGRLPGKGAAMGMILRLVLLAAVLAAGYFLPRALIPAGVEGFEGADRYRAQMVLDGVKNGAWSDSDTAPEELLVALITTAYRVEAVGPCDGWPAEEAREPGPILEPSTTPEQREEELRKEVGPEYREAPLEAFTGFSHHRVRLFTLFGIPYGTDTLTCDEAR
jgi:hypothetical protein